MIDPKTPGYDRWCEAARRAHLDSWNTATPETREPWIVEARDKEIDHTRRVSRPVMAADDGSRLTSERRDGQKVPPKPKG